MFDAFKKNREVKKEALRVIDEEILEKATDADEMVKLMDARRKIQKELDPNDVLKVVANVAIVAILVGVEYSHVLNQKGSRFLKVL